MYGIFSKLIMKASSDRRHRRRSGVVIVNFEHISQFFLVILLFNLNSPLFAGIFLTIISLSKFLRRSFSDIANTMQQ